MRILAGLVKSAGPVFIQILRSFTCVEEWREFSIFIVTGKSIIVKPLYEQFQLFGSKTYANLDST